MKYVFTVIFIFFITADGTGSDVDSNNITDLLNEPGKKITTFIFSNSPKLQEKLSKFLKELKKLLKLQSY